VGWRSTALALALIPIGATYVIAAFAAPDPILRIVLRSLPFLPVTAWTLWFDRSRPLEHQPPLVRLGGRVVLLLAVMVLVIVVLGLGLNWLYDPQRVV
jgi:hypothetical protein